METTNNDLRDLLELAWGIIANSYGGNWDLASLEWREAAIRWRDRYHATLSDFPNTSETPVSSDIKVV